jgi:HTH-type transcriptional regulator/antitoxin HigA
MEAMSTIAEIDLKTYGRLLAKTTPVVIKNEEDNERMLAVVEKLMRKGEDKLTPEEDTLLELLLDLVHHFEEEHYPIPKSPPRGILLFLREQKGLMPKDLWSVLGSKSRTSEILSGKRSISKDQAKKLASFFKVSADLFL